MEDETPQATEESLEKVETVDLPSREELHVDMVKRSRAFIKIEVLRGAKHQEAVGLFLAALAAAMDSGWSDDPKVAPNMEIHATSAAKTVAKFIEKRWSRGISLNYLICIFFYALSYTATQFGRQMKTPTQNSLNGHG
jgi:hypothetical protein